MDSAGLEHPDSPDVTLSDRLYVAALSGKFIGITIPGFSKLPNDPLRLCMLVIQCGANGSIRRVTIRSGVTVYLQVLRLAKHLKDHVPEVAVEVVPPNGQRPIQQTDRPVGPLTELASQRERISCVLLNELIFLEYRVYDWMRAAGLSALIPANAEGYSLFPDLFGSVQAGKRIAISIGGFTGNLLPARTISCKVDADTGLITSLTIKVYQVEPKMYGLLDSLPRRMNAAIQDILGEVSTQPRLLPDQQQYGFIPPELRSPNGLGPPLPPHPSVERLRHYLHHVHMASLSGATGWSPRNPGEEAARQFAATHIPPAMQNWHASMMNQPLPYPQLGRSPHLDAVIHSTWAAGRCLPPIVADLHRRIGIPGCEPPLLGGPPPSLPPIIG
jgi:hypothetical protein